MFLTLNAVFVTPMSMFSLIGVASMLIVLHMLQVVTGLFAYGISPTAFSPIKTKLELLEYVHHFIPRSG